MERERERDGERVCTSGDLDREPRDSERRRLRGGVRIGDRERDAPLGEREIDSDRERECWLTSMGLLLV